MQSWLTGSDPVEIELTVVDIGGARKGVVIAPVGASLRLLVEQRAGRTEEPEVSDSSACNPHAHVEGFAS